MTNEELKKLSEQLNKDLQKTSYVDLPEGASVEVINYTITIDPFEYDNWAKQIGRSEPIEARGILGLLLGRAKQTRIVNIPNVKK